MLTKTKSRVPSRDYYDTYDYQSGDTVNPKPMVCNDCEAPVFYEDEGEPGGYYHAVLTPHPQCFGPQSWIMGDVDDPNHPLYAEWMAKHPIGEKF